jgi:hypothetical protein
MTKTELLKRFAAQHSIDLSGLPEFERQSICCMLRCLDALDADYAALSDETLASDPAVGVILQLLARCAEHVKGALVAFTGAAGASAELVSRAAIESAVTIRFILQDPSPRLAGYFRHHVDDVDKQVSHWRRTAESLPAVARAIHEAACDQREAANREMRVFVSRLEGEILGARLREPWPARVADRFKSVDDEVTYRTVYARLCAETHFDAEETLRFILGRISGGGLMDRMALETIGFTRLMIAIAVCYFLQAAADYASRYAMTNCTRECQVGLQLMHQISGVLSEHVGAKPNGEKPTN